MNNHLLYQRQGKLIGVISTILLHLVLATFLVVKGVKIIYPPPAEKGIEVEFAQEISQVEEIEEFGEEPSAEEVTQEEPISLVQKVQSPIKDISPQQTAPSSVDKKGDVEKVENQEEEEINERSIFTSRNAPTPKRGEQTATDSSKTYKGGIAQGNTENGNLSGNATANLEGRNVLGNLPKPQYRVNKEGRVVVKIVVDREGNVTQATPGQKGTTQDDPELWRAAKEAAMRAKFSPTSQEAISQVGTIIYDYKLR